MPGVARELDSCGGLIQPGANTFVREGGRLLAVVGTPISPHGSGAHAAATLAQGSLVLRVSGVPVSLLGHPATCGHVVSTASTLLDVSL